MKLPIVVLFALLALPALSQDDEIVLREGVSIASVGRYGRAPIHTDAVESLIVNGKWTAPKAGDTVLLADGRKRAWQAVKADNDGWFESAGYVDIVSNSPTNRVMMLNAAGHSLVYVNGILRTGDPYSAGYVHVPVALKSGDNEFLFQVGRGRVRAALQPTKSSAFIDLSDTTLPDLTAGKRYDGWGAVLVVNATNAAFKNLRMTSICANGAEINTEIPSLPPLTVRKIGFRISGAPSASGPTILYLRLRKSGDADNLDAAQTELRVRNPKDTRKVTFISSTDGSVQYYALNPAHPLSKTALPPALVLSLHGAGVEAIGQADAYEGKTWANLVAPTNRRPFGFDWEDWGRMDAIEVLDQAQKTLKYDPARVYLTGHSMGGHGTWIMGATYPDRFAAIGPSAGWISFWSYGGASVLNAKDAIADMLMRSADPGDTLSLIHNYAMLGVYVLHGVADDNVPISEAREMRKRLAEFHHDVDFHEQPGAGHWWDASDEPGADCVDWAPMFDFFGRHALPTDEMTRRVNFTTANPGVSAKCRWLTIEAQIHPLRFSSADIQWDPGQRRFTGTTGNVARLCLNLDHVAPGADLKAELDGRKLDKIAWPKNGCLWLAHDGDSWTVVNRPSSEVKNPRRCGPFKEAFNHRVLFVYGTGGSEEENGQMLAKARYDAETFRVRGNASIDVVPDVDFRADRDKERSVVLYGNADTNRAWKSLLANSPVQVRRGAVTVGKKELAGTGLACLFVRPRPGSETALVAAMAGTDMAGAHLTERMPIFTSGIAYPDCIVVGVDSLAKDIDGVLGAGFFGNDWSVETGEFAWRE